MSTVCVVGLGHIGLPTAAMLASQGFDVTGYDLDVRRVAQVNAGEAPFAEPELATLLAAARRSGRLRAQAQPSPADYTILAVPTPLRADRQPDLSQVEAALDAIAPLLRPGDTVILESTAPVGTTEALAARLAMARPALRIPRHGEPGDGADIHLAHCPERLLPGRMLAELLANERIIGGLTPACGRRALALYAGWVRGACHLTDSRTAEFVKLAENAYRDVNIAFANELASLAEYQGVDPWQAIAFANRHPRVEILHPGAGVGGHCIAVDPWFLAAAAPEAAPLIRAARAVNDDKPRQVASRILALAAPLAAATVACFGLTYKPDVDDLRESPAVAILRLLAARGAIRLLVVEPHLPALPAALRSLGDITLVSAETALRAADIIAFLVGHRAFHDLDRAALRQRLVVDPIGLLR